MSVLVTGGAGYIGGHAVRTLVERGEEVLVLDDLSTGRRDQIPATVEFVQGNAGHIDSVFSLLKTRRIRSILHFAGSIRVDESVRNPLKYYKNNVEVSRRLLEAAVLAEVEHFVFSSSAAVYGTPRQIPVPEDAPLAPLSPYGRSKAMVEQMLEDVAAVSPLRYVALRYFNVAGADPAGKAGYAIESQPSHLIKAALAAATGRNNGLEIFGTDYPTPDGTCVRDYIHVSDLADAHAEALQYLQRGGVSETLNCGYGRGHSVLEVVEAVEGEMKTTFPVKFSPRRQGDAARVVADTKRIKAVLPNWRPRFADLKLMIKDQHAWEKSQLEPTAR